MTTTPPPEQIDIVGTWPAEGHVIDGDLFLALRCSRCDELTLGVEGDRHWVDLGVENGKRHMRLCRSRDGVVGVLRRPG